MKYKDTIHKLNLWRGHQAISSIRTNKIDVTHKTHLKTDTINFNNNLTELSCNRHGKVVPIIVRKLKTGRYQLLFGLKQLIKAKLSNNNCIDAIVVGVIRGEVINFLKKDDIDNNSKTVDIDTIKISPVFASTIPKPHKVEFKRNLIENGLIPTIKIDENNLLHDGYITYLILKEKGIKEALVSTFDIK